MNANEAWAWNEEWARKKARKELVKRISYEPTDGPKHLRWSAIDPDPYTGPGDPVGLGATKQDARDDLLEQMEW